MKIFTNSPRLFSLRWTLSLVFPHGCCPLQHLWEINLKKQSCRDTCPKMCIWLFSGEGKKTSPSVKQLKAATSPFSLSGHDHFRVAGILACSLSDGFRAWAWQVPNNLGEVKRKIVPGYVNGVKEFITNRTEAVICLKCNFFPVMNPRE